MADLKDTDLSGLVNFSGVEKSREGRPDPGAPGYTGFRHFHHCPENRDILESGSLDAINFFVGKIRSLALNEKFVPDKQAGLVGHRG